MASPFISVVIPTFNRPCAIERCLASIALVDYPRDEFEVIVVNDGGSIPGSRDDLDVKVLTQHNRGPAAARNTGVGNATGEFIAFIDDDCTVPADWLENLSSAFRKSPDALIGGRTVNALANNSCSSTSQTIIDYVYKYYDGSPERPRFFASNNLSVRAEHFRKLGGFDENFRTAEDRDFCRRWNAAGRPMVYDPNVVIRHAHELGVSSLHKQHFTYGRGAYPYWQNVAKNGASFRIEPVSFYTGMLAEPFRSRTRSAPLIAALTFTAQVANAAGFFYEMARDLLLSRTRSLVDDPVLHHEAHPLGDVNIL